MKVRTTLAAIVAASLLSVPALAAPGNANGKANSAQRAKKRAGKMDPQLREARALAKLKRAGVDEVRAKRVIAVNKRFRTQKQKVKAASKIHRQALRKLLQSNSTNEAAYKAALDQLFASQVKMQTLKNTRSAALRTILKPSEQAKVLRMTRKAKAGKKGRRGKKAGKGKRIKFGKKGAQAMTAPVAPIDAS